MKGITYRICFDKPLFRGPENTLYMHLGYIANILIFDYASTSYDDWVLTGWVTLKCNPVSSACNNFQSVSSYLSRNF